MSAIKIKAISKKFDDTQALDQISFEVQSGERFGLIGPDGAGKSTLFQILTSLLIPDTGDAWVEGLHTVKDFKKLRRIIGYMPGRFSLYQDLSVEENLTFFATIFGTSLAENYDLIKDIYVQIEPFRKRRAGKLSGGMKQKLALSCALIHRPKVLFLDEPTTGVDAVSRDEFWEMLGRLQEYGITILVSTPYMDEAARCERIALIQQGEIMKVDSPEGIRAAYQKPLFALRSKEPYRLMQDLRRATFIESVEPFGEYLHVATRSVEAKELILPFLRKRDHQEIEMKSIRPTIEDVFLDLIQ